MLPTAQSPYAGPDAEQWAADEKTRANAAGAVGNLIRLGFVSRSVALYRMDSLFNSYFNDTLRNSGQLSVLMAELKVPQQLMSIVINKSGNEIVTQVFTCFTTMICGCFYSSLPSLEDCSVFSRDNGRVLRH